MAPNALWDIQIDMIPLPFVLMADFIALGEDISDFSDPMRQVVGRMRTSIGENFDVGGRPPWQELAAETLARKQGEGILIETEALMNVATSEGIWTVDDESAFIDGLPSEVGYGMYHQLGAGNNPERPFLLIQPEDEDEIENIFDNWIGDLVGSHGW